MDVVNYVLIFLIAHVLGDFYFQSENMANKKQNSYIGVLIHSIEYLIVSLCVVVPIISFDMVIASLSLSFLHCLIDTVKYLLIKNRIISRADKIFIWDQVLHIFTILLLSYVMYYMKFNISSYKIVDDIFEAYNVKKQVFAREVLVLLFLCKPANILIQNLLLGYKPHENVDSKLIVIDNKVGRRIGILERLILLMLIVMDQYAALGLVLTAKSIARYDKIAKDEKFAEYYLLGTLMSTACVILCKLLFL